MTLQEWVQNISAGATLILLVLAGMFVAIRKLMKSTRALFDEMRAGVEATKKQATTAALQSTAAATSAAKVDDSMHSNNGGDHLKDFTDEVRSAIKDVRRDIGGMRDDLRTLAKVDSQDREAASAADAQLHDRINALQRRT